MILLTPVFYWTMLGLTFMAIEVFFPSFFFALSLSLSSLTNTLLSYKGFDSDQTLFAFMLLTPVWFILLKGLATYCTRHTYYKASLEEPCLHESVIIRNSATYDLPKIVHQGTSWSVQEKDGHELCHNDRVKVLYIKGNKFIVLKIK